MSVSTQATGNSLGESLGEPVSLKAKDWGLGCLLASTAVMLVWSWVRQEGYQLADSVEYLERAQGIAHGHALIDSVAIRAFGFSGLLVPLFWIYDALGLTEPVRIMQAAQLLQVLLTLALVAATARLCARFAGRAGGLAAGALLGFNPIVLRWGVEPVSGIAAALFVTLAVSRAVGDRRIAFSWPWSSKLPAASSPQLPPRMRDAWITGGWLGLAFLMAYQTILVVGAVLVVLFIRDVRRQPRWIAAVFGGLFGVVLLQCALDRWYYGSFGISVSTYFIENFGSSAALLFHKGGKLPLVGPFFLRVSHWIYNGLFQVGENTLKYQDQVVAGEKQITSKLPPSWYFTHLANCLVAPAAILVGFGLLRCVVQALRGTAVLWFVVAANVLIMSFKGSKDFRLWLPIFVAWLLKVLVLRYGGLKMYRQALPLALGLVVGEFVAVS